VLDRCHRVVAMNEDAIGFCGAYYPRKAPERVLAIARAFPERRVLLLGPAWERWEGYGELAALPNLERLELPYEQYPAYYRRLRVLVSPSRLEGGPMPLLEALCSGIPVAASRTGFAPDIVRDGVDGVLFDPDADDRTAVAAVARALALPPVADPPARRCTWERFAGIVAGAWRFPATARAGSGRGEA
jgi:glycosyltransferase involved in cell wall biosynthesis